MRKNIFNSRYQGPRGRHLSCLTETSMFGDYTAEHQRTIHAGSGASEKTRGRRLDGGRICEARNPARKGHLAKASYKLDLRRREHEQTKTYIESKAGMVWADGMYKVPGSMNIG